MIDIDLARTAVAYDPETGLFRAKEAPASSFKDGKRSAQARANLRNGMMRDRQCGTQNERGYVRVRILGASVYAHRLAWALTHGQWPNKIDHINGDRSDNRIANLRSVDSLENGHNQRLRKNNTSGVLGVRWNKNAQKWIARIFFNGREINLGAFENRDDAVAARSQAEIEHGFHPNHGRRT